MGGGEAGPSSPSPTTMTCRNRETIEKVVGKRCGRCNFIMQQPQVRAPSPDFARRIQGMCRPLGRMGSRAARFLREWVWAWRTSCACQVLWCKPSLGLAGTKARCIPGLLPPITSCPLRQHTLTLPPPIHHPTHTSITMASLHCMSALRLLIHCAQLRLPTGPAPTTQLLLQCCAAQSPRP